MSALDKKIKTLREALPRLDEAEARRLLEKAGGSINKASDMALEDGEWTSADNKKKVVKKVEKTEKAAPARREDAKDRPRRDFADRKPRFEEPKAAAKKVETKATPSTIVVGGSKSKVETGISFADMIKRQKQPEHVEVAPEPEVVETPAQEAPVVAEEPEVAPAAPVAEVPKPKREKKEIKKKAAPLPQKYEAEIDRLATVNFPQNIVELASGAFTFTSEPGRAPSPPRQVQPVHQQMAQQHQQNDWNHNAPRQAVQRTWNNQQQDYGNRNQHFTGEWRQQQPRNNYDGQQGYNNHRMNTQQQYRGDSYNNANNSHVGARPVPQAQPQQAANNFW